jgi:hypothetical protein
MQTICRLSTITTFILVDDTYAEQATIDYTSPR